MLVRKILFDPFFYVLKKFLCPEKFEQGIIKKKLSTQANNRTGWKCSPPPHHFSNGPSLNKSKTFKT
jgi:hypothetical protein